MSVVVADTSPINYLILIECIEVLHRLYGTVLVPVEVVAELQSAHAPAAVATWVRSMPDWVQVQAIVAQDESEDLALRSIDCGERAAILLASQQKNALLLIDDSAGRAVAAARGLPVVGTLGVLRAAAAEGLIELRDVLPKLLGTNFRVARRLVDELLERN